MGGARACVCVLHMCVTPSILPLIQILHTAAGLRRTHLDFFYTLIKLQLEKLAGLFTQILGKHIITIYTNNRFEHYYVLVSVALIIQVAFSSLFIIYP